jgi:pimeloyl-ACP methyl ester carboxylesterase
MLGYGYSDKPQNADYSTHYQAQLTFSLLEQRRIRRIHIMAYSYGVSVAQQMLCIQSQRNLKIASISFLNGGLFTGSNHPHLAQRLMLGRLGKLMVKLFNKRTLAKNLRAIFGPDTQPSEELISQYWSLIAINSGKSLLPKLIQYLKERQTYDKYWENGLKEATCPIQLLVGAYDSISGKEVAQEFIEKISTNNVHLLENIGHYPQLESPEAVLTQYFDFVQKYKLMSS